MEKGTVIYIGGFEMPDKNAAAQRVVSNSKAIKELGYNVVFISLSKTINSNTIVKQEFFNSDVYSKKYPTKITEWVGHLISFKYYLNIIKNYNNVKAIICYNLPSVSLLRLKKWSNNNNITIIADCTEWYETTKGESILKRIVKSFDIYARMHLIQPRLDGVIAISDFLEKFYKNKGVKTINIPPLTDAEDVKWKPLPLEIRDWIEIVYIGSPFSLETKGQKDRLDNLVEIIQELSKDINVKFNIVGIDKEVFLSFYPVFEKTLNEEVIKFYGRKPHLEAIDILKRSDFSIFLREDTLTNRAGFPTKFIEAITCGVTVLTNKNANLLKFLVEGKNGFWLDNSNFNSLKESLYKALNTDRSILNEMKSETIKTKLFDYRNYKLKFKFIDK